MVVKSSVIFPRMHPHAHLHRKAEPTLLGRFVRVNVC